MTSPEIVPTREITTKIDKTFLILVGGERRRGEGREGVRPLPKRRKRKVGAYA